MLGLARVGWAQLRLFGLGSAVSTELDWARLHCVNLGLNWPGWAVLGPAGLGSARLGSAGLGLA